MILRLVERRTRPGPVGSEWTAGEGRLDLLNELSAEVGRPEWTVDLVLVEDGAMARLNRQYRKMEGVTDVLSFAYVQPEGDGEPDLKRGHGRAFADLWLDRLGPGPENGPPQEPVVGDIVLAPGFVADRCREKGWPLDLEVPLLVVHGLLHILGWDHETPDTRSAMQAIERDILAVQELPHPLLDRS